MTATNVLSIASTTMDRVTSNFTTVLPSILPFVVGVIALYASWRLIKHFSGWGR